MRPLACARSLEKHCVQRAASIEPRCESPVESQLQSGVGHQRAVWPRLAWRHVVIGIAVHYSAAEERLLQAAADTWLRMAGGADLVLVTDIDDPRNASAIAPRMATGGDALTVHVFRCAECRGAKCTGTAAADSAGAGTGGCAGVREGWLARRKVLHMFVAMARLFSVVPSPTSGSHLDGGAPRKEIFIKVDPDTVPVPHNLLRLLGELDATLGRSQPYYFGMAACRVASFALCHAAGGAGYGLSRSAVGMLDGYLAAEYPRLLPRVDKFTYGGEDVTVAFALKKAGGVSVVNAGCLYQHEPRKYTKLHAKGEAWVRWPLSTTPASFHKFKDAEEMRTFFKCALYDSDGKPRPAPRSLFATACKQAGVRAPRATDGKASASAIVRDVGVVSMRSAA